MYQPQQINTQASPERQIQTVDANMQAVFKILNEHKNAIDGLKSTMNNFIREIYTALENNDGIIPGSNKLLRIYSDDSGATGKLQRRPDISSAWIDTGTQWG